MLPNYSKFAVRGGRWRTEGGEERVGRRSVQLLPVPRHLSTRRTLPGRTPHSVLQVRTSLQSLHLYTRLTFLCFRVRHYGW